MRPFHSSNGFPAWLVLGTVNMLAFFERERGGFNSGPPTPRTESQVPFHASSVVIHTNADCHMPSGPQIPPNPPPQTPPQPQQTLSLPSLRPLLLR
eukprot:2567117-Rhodomonas_salina.1